ncbi:MAG: FG-GAP repeat protein [Porticoccaceae bacterium]
MSRFCCTLLLPVHTEVVDFDGDGDRDIIVAALQRAPTSTGEGSGK